MVSSAGIKTFIMDTRVNKGLKDDKIERIYSWPHLYMKLKKLENYNYLLKCKKNEEENKCNFMNIQFMNL